MTIAQNVAEQNKAIVREMLPDFDRAPLEATDKWLAPDFTTVMNGEAPMNLEAYRQMVGSITQSFSNIRHEIVELLAEDDRVALAMTLHLTHTGEFEGIPATGRTIRIAEIAVFRMRDGKIVSERVVVDFAGLHQQLTAK